MPLAWPLNANGMYIFFVCVWPVLETISAVVDNA